MTDEEKAEEYLDKHKECTQLKGVYHLTVNEKQAYLDGMAEGRKEGYEQGKNNERELQCGKKNYKKDISRLEKENAELKEQIDQLSNDNHVLKTSFITQQEQIEKMKCCENCKYHSFWGDELKCNLPSYDEEFKCLDDKDKWEYGE